MLAIKKIETSKDKIIQPKLAEDGHIPRINTSTIFCGRSGSGKSLALVNLLTRPEMLGGAFDQTFLISPTGASDDIQKALNIKKENVFIDVLEGINHIEKVLNINRMLITAVGADKAPLICLIYDDIIAERDVLKHPMFVRSFIASRHFNCTTFACTQSWTAVPRKCRLQANNVIMFPCSQDEALNIADTFTPAGMSKKDFLKMLAYATGDPYSFMYINLTQPRETRYRKTFETILTLT